MSGSDRQSEPSRPSSRLAGIGVEFAATMIGFVLIGLWIDRHWHVKRHWGLIIATTIGVAGGMYNFLRQALKATREGQRTRGPETPGRPPGNGA